MIHSPVSPLFFNPNLIQLQVVTVSSDNLADVEFSETDIIQAFSEVIGFSLLSGFSLLRANSFLRMVFLFYDNNQRFTIF